MEQVLVFRLGSHFYGLEISNIQEVVESPIHYFIPRASEHFRGAINFHGSVVPVLDLPAYLGLSGDQKDPRIIVLASRLCQMALAVTAMHKIIWPEVESFLPVEEGEGAMNLFVRGAIIRDEEDSRIYLLDVTQLLASLGPPEKGAGGKNGA